MFPIGSVPIALYPSFVNSDAFLSIIDLNGILGINDANLLADISVRNAIMMLVLVDMYMGGLIYRPH